MEYGLTGWAGMRVLPRTLIQRGKDLGSFVGSRISLDPDERATRLLILIAFGFAVIYVSLALTPSHYSLGLKRLGAEVRPLFLNAQGVRSDEISVLTPLMQTAVRGGFSSHNQISPYHESLKGFFALPILDWSLIFKPQLWGFWVLPPAYAYSFYFCSFWVAFLMGYTLLLAQLGAKPVIAAFGSLCLFFSPFVQAWWTTNAPTFAFAPWPAVILLLNLRPGAKLPLLFWTGSAWVFGLAYPPFIISAAFALGILIAAFRRDVFTISNGLVVLIAAALFGVVFHWYFGDLVDVMRDTIYPGHRVSSGGGVDPSKLIAHLFPFFTAVFFLPIFKENQFIPLLKENFCEIAAISTFLPMTLLCFARHSSVWKVLKADRLAWSIVAGGLISMAAWMVLPIPAAFGRFLLWSSVPPERMLWGFGFLLTLSTIVLISKSDFVISRRRAAIFVGVLLSGGLISKFLYIVIWKTADLSFEQALLMSPFEWTAILLFLVFAGGLSNSRLVEQASPQRLVLGAAIAGLYSIGAFNPFQQAFPIFDIPRTEKLETLRLESQRAPNGWIVIPNNYGALLSGAGISAINHVLTTPELGFFRAVFPDMPETEFNHVFNRYAHIVPRAGITLPFVLQNDMIAVPIDAFKKKIVVPGQSER
ncbi:DUF7657 domain-containing protein [Aestuariivirga sp.]|uniref:DUF7657 domain-containing protein n=1 Tax=Aestuariivirga sp. TaxID=2650926 RepID=UPI003BAC628B